VGDGGRVRASHWAGPPSAGAGESTPRQSEPAPKHQKREESIQAGTEGVQLSVEKLADLWPQIRRDVKAVNRQIEAVLQCADPVAVQGDLITLASPYPFHRNRLNTDEFREVVEDVISRIVQSRVRITCILREEMPAAPVATGGGPSAPEVPLRDSSPVNGSGDVLTPSIEVAEEPMDDLDEQRVKAAKNIFDAEEISG
jgi:hypothetical protein